MRVNGRRIGGMIDEGEDEDDGWGGKMIMFISPVALLLTITSN